MAALVAILLVTLTPRIFAADDLITANKRFSIDLYREISKTTDDNFLFSPFSALSVLAFLQSGARGSTAKELRRSLHLPHDKQKVEAGFRDAHQAMRNNPGYVFTTANRLYIQDNFNINWNFVATATSVFDAQVNTTNFGQSEAAARQMNRWVAEKTDNKITDLISPDKLSAVTRAVLINALYFKANWSTPFRRLSTRNRQFLKPNGQFTSVMTMTMNEDSKTFNYAEDDELGAQFLELKFQGNEASMVIVLPFDKFGLARLENNMDKVLERPDFAREYVNMSIPKFKLDSSTDLKPVLQILGVHQAFSAGHADFGGISDQSLSVSDVIQKTFIDVNEGGVEAAAATYAGLTLLSIQSTPKPKQFHVNHPFVYYIQVRGLVVFAGRVVDPWLASL